jgi:hypothetical protein
MQHFISNIEINNIDIDLNQKELADKDVISKRVSEIRSTLQELLKELDELVASCGHQNGYDIKLLNATNLNTGGLRKVCKTCGSPIGYASQAEIDEWKES